MGEGGKGTIRGNMTEQTESNQTRTYSRRKTLIAGGSVLALGAFSVAAMSGTASASIDIGDTQFTANGAGVASHDGSIDSIEVDPSIEVIYEGFRADEEIDIEITFSTTVEDDDITLEESKTLPSTSGSETFDLSAKDLLEEWNAENFEAEDDGTDNETTITATIDVTSDYTDVSGDASDSFVVTVTNHSADFGFSAEVTTTVGSDEEVDD